MEESWPAKERKKGKKRKREEREQQNGARSRCLSVSVNERWAQMDEQMTYIFEFDDTIVISFAQNGIQLSNKFGMDSRVPHDEEENSTR